MDEGGAADGAGVQFSDYPRRFRGGGQVYDGLQDRGGHGEGDDRGA